MQFRMNQKNYPNLELAFEQARASFLFSRIFFRSIFRVNFAKDYFGTRSATQNGEPAQKDQRAQTQQTAQKAGPRCGVTVQGFEARLGLREKQLRHVVLFIRFNWRDHFTIVALSPELD